MTFGRASKHIYIGSIDSGSEENGPLTVKAQYNPSTLQVDQNVPWKKPDAATQGGQQPAASSTGGKGGGGGAGGASKGPDNSMALEFTGAEGRSLTVELLFDAVEGAGARSVDVKAEVGKLETLARVRDPKSKDEKLRRPHHCVVVWGGVLPRFECVIENLSTKYSMFSSEGEPLRATCTVKLKEAKIVDKKEK